MSSSETSKEAWERELWGGRDPMCSAPLRRLPQLGPGALHTLPRPVLLRPTLTRGTPTSRVPPSPIFHGEPFSQQWRGWKWWGRGCHQDWWHLGGDRPVSGDSGESGLGSVLALLGKHGEPPGICAAQRWPEEEYARPVPLVSPCPPMLGAWVS